MLWADTTNNLLKQMNSANTAWVVLGSLGVANLGLQAALPTGTSSEYLGGDLALHPLFPGAGVPLSTGSAWGTSYTVGTGPNDLVQLNSGGQLPAVSGALLTNLPATGGGFTTQNVVTSSRTLGTVYQNTTGKTIWVSAGSGAYMSGQWTAYSDASSSPATEVGVSYQGNGNCTVSFMVLNNNYYKITATAGTLGYWIEWY